MKRTSMAFRAWGAAVAAGGLLVVAALLGTGAVTVSPNFVQWFGTNTSFGYFSRVNLSNVNMRVSSGTLYITPLGSGSGGGGTGSFVFASSQFEVVDDTNVVIKPAAALTNFSGYGGTMLSDLLPAEDEPVFLGSDAAPWATVTATNFSALAAVTGVDATFTGTIIGAGGRFSQTLTGNVVRAKFYELPTPTANRIAMIGPDNTLTNAPSAVTISSAGNLGGVNNLNATGAVSSLSGTFGSITLTGAAPGAIWFSIFTNTAISETTNFAINFDAGQKQYIEMAAGVNFTHATNHFNGTNKSVRTLLRNVSGSAQTLTWPAAWVDFGAHTTNNVVVPAGARVISTTETDDAQSTNILFAISVSN